jgi:endonuclease YncB( thermonuclease family)
MTIHGKILVRKPRGQSLLNRGAVRAGAPAFSRAEIMSFPRLIAFAFHLAFPACAVAQLSGEVVRVDDGDTLILQDAKKRAHTVRILGIDAPELGQEFGAAAQSNLLRLARGRAAHAECRAALSPSAQLCVVRVDGNDLGFAQIRDGMAWRWPAHAAKQTSKERADYDQAEFLVKLRRAGLWNAKNPTPPWVWRGKRTER